jgi:hypothetical protein
MNLREMMQTPIGEYAPIGDKPDVLWRYDAKTFKAYTEDLETKRRLTKVTGSVIACRYYDSKLGRCYWDFIIPNKRLRTVMRILSRGKEVGNF